MFATKSALTHGLVAATFLCVTHAAWAAEPSATASPTVAKKADGKESNAGDAQGQPRVWGAPLPFWSLSEAPPPKPGPAPVAAKKPPPGSQTGPTNPAAPVKAGATKGNPPPFVTPSKE